MLAGLKHWWMVRRMQRRRALILKAYEKDIAAAKAASKPESELERIHYDEHQELRFVDDELDILESRRLVSLASHYRVPIPQGKDDWEESTIFGSRSLTRAAASKLRSDIRSEQKARWDYWYSRVQLIGSLVGIVGGIMGALAYFKTPPPPHR